MDCSSGWKPASANASTTSSRASRPPGDPAARPAHRSEHNASTRVFIIEFWGRPRPKGVDGGRRRGMLKRSKEAPLERKTAQDFDPDLLILFDAYVHGALDRRGFLDKAARYAVGGVTAAMLLDQLSP